MSTAKISDTRIGCESPARESGNLNRPKIFRKPDMKTVLAIVVISFLAAVAAAADDNGGSVDDTPPTVSIDSLVNIFGSSRDNDRAEREYGHKILRFEGYVHAKSVGGDDIPFVEVYRFSARTTHARCFFAAEAVDEVKALPTDQMLFFQGTCKGYDPGIDAVVFESCTVVPQERDE